MTSPSAISTPTIAIIGGGIAGLSAAVELLELAAARQQPLRVEIFEQNTHCGGNIATVADGGFLCECGPEGFLDNVPETLDLARRIGLGEQLLRADPAADKRFILRAGRLREVPISPPAFLLSDLLPLAPRLRVLLEPFIPARRDEADESVFDFAARRIGKGAAAQLVDAMVSGVYAGDAHQLSLPSAFPKMRAMEREYGSLVRAMIVRQRQAKKSGERIGGPSGPRGTLTNFSRGMGSFIEALAQAVGRERIHLESGVETIERLGARWRLHLKNGAAFDADAVIATAPAPATAQSLAALDAGLAQALGSIPFAGIAVLGLGYRRQEVAHPLNGFGFLIPRAEGLHSLGALWSSSTFPDRAPQGQVLMRVMIGGATNPAAVDWPEERLLEVVREEVAPRLGISAAPVWQRVFRYRRGIAQYNLGHEALLQRIGQSLAAHPGLFLAGTSYRGIAINSTCQAAPKLAAAVLDYLGGVRGIASGVF